MRHAILVAFGVAFGLAAACSQDIEASDYTQDCVADSDCVVIFVGDTCDCDCTSDAINRRDEARYRDDRPSCSGSCAPQCGPCPGMEGRCSDGRCVAVPARL